MHGIQMTMTLCVTSLCLEGILVMACDPNCLLQGPQTSKLPPKWLGEGAKCVLVPTVQKLAYFAALRPRFVPEAKTNCAFHCVKEKTWVCPWDKPGVVPRATGPQNLCLSTFSLLEGHPGNIARGTSGEYSAKNCLCLCFFF